MFGCHGAVLKVDLSAGAAQRLLLDEALLRRYPGGSGLGTALLLQEGAADIDPLSPEAAIAFVFSPLVGSPLTTSAKFAVVSRSPLTGRINDSLASSGFAIAGKKTGVDAILITGRCSGLSVLIIDNGMIRIESAGQLRGASTSQTERRLRQHYGKEYETAVIGPAGEAGVRFATISHHGRHAGRGGSGAILGAKNLKAILVRGNQRTNWADPEGLIRLSKDLSARSFGPATAKYRELGTATNLLTFNRLHVLPTRNFQQGSFEGADPISPEQMGQTHEKIRTSCVACTIGCEHLYQMSDGSQPVRMEYENLFALGPMCGISSSEAVLKSSQFCDEAGMDTISAGGTIAFAMECAERGLIDEPWLRFGDGTALRRCLEMIVSGEGIGELLCAGSRSMALKIGGDSIAFAPQVKGLELPGYDPRGLQMMALGFAVGTRGADHNRSGAYEVDFSSEVDRRHGMTADVPRAIETENRAAVMDSLILCKFIRGVLEDFWGETSEMLRLVTGWDVNAGELREIAEGIIRKKKEFNIRSGWTPAEDTLPERMLSSVLPDDPAACLPKGRLQDLILAYNRARGWTDEGWLKD
ncbi:MAG: aldehyde ferredoxin oxidoreductase family protein [Planctomycetia bacterium]